MAVSSYHTRSCNRPFGDAVAVFAELRPRLLGIAGRILRSRPEAEDVVQDVWVRWQRCDRSAVLNSTAFLVTATTRQAINVAQSARVRHETCMGEWLHEPAAIDVDPERLADREAQLELGLVVLLDMLTPVERAAYLLRVAFDYPYAEIARTLRLSEVNARQVFSRARRRVACERRPAASSDQPRPLVRAFTAAARGGGVEALEAFLTAEFHRSPTLLVSAG